MPRRTKRKEQKHPREPKNKNNILQLRRNVLLHLKVNKKTKQDIN